MSSFVVIIGEGRLADTVAEELSSRYQVFRRTDFEYGLPENSELMLVLHDTWNPVAHQKAEEAVKLTGSPWLRAFVSFGEGIIGPLVKPGTPGCSQCADLRKLLGGQERGEMQEVKQKLGAEKETASDPWVSKNGLLHLVHVIVTEADRVLAGKEGFSAGRMYFTDLKTLNGSWHSFLADSLCQVCSTIPEDSASLAKISLKPSLKISASSYRCTPLDEMKEVLFDDYFDNRTGLLNSKMYDLVTPFADASVNLPMVSGGNEGTAGRTQCYAESEMTAILEGLERHCGLQPRGKRTVIHDSYRNLEKQALNPLTVGVHADAEYEKPGFPFERFNPDSPMDWVWGYSLMEERPILVPELLSYYSLGCGSAGFVYETSNGCALGGSREEAIFYGIMEVVERDSFLLSWYSKLELPRLDLQSAEDEELLLMAERMRAVAGYDLYLFNSTMEHGIPSVWAMAKNRKEKGLNLICAAGAHLDPVKAAKSAVQELAGMMLNLDGKLEGSKEKYLQMLEDDSLVREMDDHGMLYGLPQAEERLGFLLDHDRPLQSFQDAFQKKELRHNDLTEDLKGILDEFRNLGLNVIVVDQTPPELKKNGLYCVKVLIPGMLPMTFGHHLTRLKGLDRVLHVPMKLGYVKEPLSFEELNNFPHPFP
ncbi:TOMM precursor leader peptide-binding protein [Mesobacillus selenatarsenatis]|uniref:TOMM leader peptide-binding protein n=1 Tax=Mesobacillus selenatarsenatis TaxID=388741 RepID=A0A846TAN1_9BACI|nr:TOMM precursor leader peptide-binding protein [Mesobacillus selenatarsenatis]NKE03910.1 TOMM precursor leader peptide-binding protein [Mesobacillus selenatarsenatis]